MKKHISWMLIVVTLFSFLLSDTALAKGHGSRSRSRSRISTHRHTKPETKNTQKKNDSTSSTDSNSNSSYPWWHFRSRRTNKTVYVCVKCGCRNLDTGWFSSTCNNCNHDEKDHVRK